MSRADQLDPFASLGEWIACEIRKRREAAGILQADLGRILAVSAQQVSHLETGRRRLRIEQARRLDELWCTDGLFQKLWTHAQREHDREWFRRFTAYERRASVIRIFQPLIMPGLFQTADYARALLDAGHTADPDERLAARMQRQDILERADPPTVWTLVSETVLRNPVGGSDVLRLQLTRLLEIAKMPHVTVQVVRMGIGAHVGLDGGYILLTVDNEDIAFIEAQLSGRLVRDEGEVSELAVRYDRIRAMALPEYESISLVTSVLEELACGR